MQTKKKPATKSVRLSLKAYQALKRSKKEFRLSTYSDIVTLLFDRSQLLKAYQDDEEITELLRNRKND